MPQAALTRQQFDGFRGGAYDTAAEHCRVHFATPWDLLDVKIDSFPMPASVVFGTRASEASALPTRVQAWSGRVKGSADWSEVADAFTVVETDTTAFTVDDAPKSEYAARFRQGATLVPRMLALVVDGPTTPMGTAVGMLSVQSRKSSLDKEPWKSLPIHTGTVEATFVRTVLLGESVLPFRVDRPSRGVIPHDGTDVLDGSNPRIDRYPGLAKWWRAAEAIWEENAGPKNTLALGGRFDFHRELRAQFPAAPIRVVYSKAGNHLAAAVVRDANAVIDHMLYWGAAASESESLFLVTVLNSTTLGDAVRPFQSAGAFGPRHFDKYVWYAPIPIFDSANALHLDLARLGAAAEAVAASVPLAEGVGFQAARAQVRAALAGSIGPDIESAVRSLLQF